MRPLNRLWWLNPTLLFAAIVGSTMLIAAAQSDAVYRLYGTPKYIEEGHVVLTAMAIAVFALGHCLAAATGRIPDQTGAEADRVVHFWFWLMVGLTLFGYAVWAAVGIKNGFSLGALRELLTTDDPEVFGQMRNVLARIKGVTSCTAFGIAAVPMGLWLYFRGYRRVLAPILLLIVLAAARALLVSERLALLELAVPALIVVVRTCVLGWRFNLLSRVSLQLAPVLGVVVLLVTFGGFEYFRSWRYYERQFDSIAEFTLFRISAYYAISHNNGAMAMKEAKPYPIPYETVRSLWTFPGLQHTPFSYAQITGMDPVTEYDLLLAKHATAEFNNEGGLFAPALDFGPAGFIVFWFGSGLVAGRLYRSFLVGTLAGLTLYPLIIMAILETPRLLYLSYTRTFPPLVGLCIMLWLVHIAESKKQAAAARLAAV